MSRPCEWATMNSRDQLVGVFTEARALLAKPGNDFTWSTWDDASEALEELDAVLLAISRGGDLDPMRLASWFAPTSDLQEVSISSRWGEAFCELADRFSVSFEAYLTEWREQAAP